MKLGPHTLRELKSQHPAGTYFKHCAVCNGTVIAEACVYNARGVNVRGLVTYKQERVILENWHRINPKRF